MTIRILQGDCCDVLKTLPDQSVHCVVTSPPYYGLRDYGVAGQIGLEPSPTLYVDRLVEVFREVRRVLRDDGTLWLNLGDSYAGSGRGGNPADSPHQKQATNRGSRAFFHDNMVENGVIGRKWVKPPAGYKQKDLIGIPWMTAFALRADGWYLRSDIIWHKPNPMPESVTDRPTSAHEHVFLFAKSGKPTIWRAIDTGEWSNSPDLSQRLPAPTDDDPAATTARWRSFCYYYDADAIREAEEVPDWDDGSRVFGGVNKHGANAQHGRTTGRRAVGRKRGLPPRHAQYESSDQSGLDQVGGGRNARNVWTVATQPFPEAHFATFPPRLIEPCIKAGSPLGGVVLDPFGGAGTTALVADRLQRSATLIELNSDYVDMARRRIVHDAPLLVKEAAE